MPQAAVFHGPKQPLTLQDFPLPVVRPGETLVRIRCATICGSDLHTLAGRRTSPTPAILGHEMVGEIAAAGGEVRDYHGSPLSPGERVTWSMVWSCGTCAFCRLALPSKCERLFKFGHERISSTAGLTGAFAEFCILPPGTAIFRVPDSLTDEEAAPANCATATAAAALRTAGDLQGAVVVVLGAGILGLTACGMARAAGARQVLAADLDPGRRRQALRFGAHAAFDPRDSSLSETVAAHETRGADAVLEFAGTPEAAEASLPLLRHGGHLVMAGAVFPSRPVAWNAEQIVRRLLRISGVYNYRPEDLQAALDFLRDHRDEFPFREVVARRFALSEIESAVSFAERERPLRVAIVPDRE